MSLVFLFSGLFVQCHFKNSPEYLTSWTAQVFIPLIRFLLYSFVSSCFLVLLRYSFLFFLSSPPIWWCHLPIFPSICWSPFLRAFWFLLNLVVRFLLSCVISRFSLLASRIFYAKLHSYILTVYFHYLH